MLLAGNGHVRRDIGVPPWLGPVVAARAFSVGYLEGGDTQAAPAYFDAVVWTDAAQRPDPCAAFRKRNVNP